MVPISKSIWQLILFVYLNLHFMSMVRFNSLYCFSKIFFRKRSKASPPNFAPPFCALCLIVCDFLPKTWNLRRKEGKSALSGGAPVKKGYRNARRRFCTPKFKIILPLNMARAQRKPFQIFFHPLSLMVASACLCSNCTNSCSSGCKGSRSGYTSTSRICCFCAGQLCSAR